MIKLEMVNIIFLGLLICYTGIFLDYFLDICKGFSGVKSLSFWL